MSLTAIPVAFLAGLVSFLAPCVLPLVPGYLSAVSAIDADKLGRPENARRVVLASLPFVLGFTAFFVVLGVGAALVGGRLFGDQFLLEKIAGFMLVVVGLAFMGLLPWPDRLVGAGLLQGARSRGSRVLLGAAFAVCAAPCIGAVLASILVLAGSAGSIARGVVLLAAYSIGLGAAFVAAGVAFAKAMSTFRWMRDHYRILQIVGGATLIAMGLLLFFERYWWLQVALNRVLESVGLDRV